MRFALLASLAACTLCVSSLSVVAEPRPDDEEKPAAVEDYLTLVVGLHSEMEAHKTPPVEEGPGRELYTAWKYNLKSRSRRLSSRAKDLTKSSMWAFDADGEHATHLQPGKWGTAVRRLASLYTDLGAARKGYDKVVVSPERAIALWDRRHPPPRTTGLTHSGVLLRHVRAEIASYRVLRKVIPGWLLRKLDRLILQERVEIAARIEARRRWEEDRVRAHDEIRARIEETRALVKAQKGLLDDQLESMRALLGALEEEEEGRLRAAVAAFPPEDEIHAKAKPLFQAMAVGRNEAERFKDPRTSRWGSLVRQKWMVPRDKLLKLIKAAEKRAAASGARKGDGEGDK